MAKTKPATGLDLIAQAARTELALPGTIIPPPPAAPMPAPARRSFRPPDADDPRRWQGRARQIRGARATRVALEQGTAAPANAHEYTRRTCPRSVHGEPLTPVAEALRAKVLGERRRCSKAARRARKAGR